MEPTDSYYTRTGSDFRYLGDLLGDPGTLPVLPLHNHGPLGIHYSVLGDSQAEKAGQYAKIVADMRTIADDQCLKFDEGTTETTNGVKHHRAVLAMPQGKVTYTAVWIERTVQEVTTDAQ